MAKKKTAPELEGDLRSQLDAANERFTQNPLRSSADLATERVSGEYTPEEIRKMMTRPPAPAAQSAMDAARANATGLSGGLPKELLRPVSPDVQATIDAARANVSKMSGGLVSAAETPGAVESGVSAMDEWVNTRKNPDGSYMNPEQAKAKFAQDQAARAQAERTLNVNNPLSPAVRETGFTMPGEPDRTLAQRGTRAISTYPMEQPGAFPNPNAGTRFTMPGSPDRTVTQVPGVDYARPNNALVPVPGTPEPSRALVPVTQTDTGVAPEILGEDPNMTPEQRKAAFLNKKQRGFTMSGEGLEAQKAAEARAAAEASAGGAASSAEAMAQEALSGNKGIGAVLKGVGRKAIPFVGDAAQGYVYGKEGNSVGRGIAAGLGSLGGRLIGGAAGTLVTPGVGTFVGEVGGSFAGAEGGARLYDRVFGGPKPPVQENVEEVAPAPVAAPAPQELSRDTRTNQEKFDDAIWNARSKQWADQEQNFKEAQSPEHHARFRAEVEAKRALESAMGAGVSQDPIANARTARAMVTAAERLGRLTGKNPATLIPELDPRFSNPVEDTAREMLRMKSENYQRMSQSEAVANALLTAPYQYRSPIQDEAQKNAIQAFAPAERVNEAQAQNEDRDLTRAQADQNAQLSRESTERTRLDAIAAGQERTKATLIGRQLASIQQQISKLSPNPSAAKMNAPRIAELQAQYKEMAKMDTTGIFGGEDVDSESDSGDITPQPTNAPTKESMKPGQTVVGKDGKTYRWTGTGFVPA
jgi:hypothetical protein